MLIFVMPASPFFFGVAIVDVRPVDLEGQVVQNTSTSTGAGCRGPPITNCHLYAVIEFSNSHPRAVPHSPCNARKDIYRVEQAPSSLIFRVSLASWQFSAPTCHSRSRPDRTATNSRNTAAMPWNLKARWNAYTEIWEPLSYGIWGTSSHSQRVFLAANPRQASASARRTPSSDATTAPSSKFVHCSTPGSTGGTRR